MIQEPKRPDPLSESAASESEAGNKQGSIDRRKAITTILALTAILGGTILSLVAGFVANAFGRKRKKGWIKVGKAEDLNSDTFGRIVLTLEHKHAWMDASVPITVYVMDRYPKDPIAFLGTCTHLGCTVAWKPKNNKFECPCHGGKYNSKGEVIDGPPPRPLTRLKTKIKGEDFYIHLPEDGGKTA